ncbi:hypothetical protein BKA66DRAFT_476285 [Pyrenochaeta sp. MPI-SDFR-AT-0127]|nr:hypothetical protein BKA66DRAFT_476285 [Pyrenochaeta sp. MPI-SDFR-AT-0127]
MKHYESDLTAIDNDHSMKSSAQSLQNQGVLKEVRPTQPILPEPQIPTVTSYPSIGIIYSTSIPRKYIFKCSAPRCGKTFNRSYDFDRHYNGAHVVEKTVHWCLISGCNRSEGNGSQPFPRNDKMIDHVRKMHKTGKGKL